ncbi:MAG: phosphonoacetate hydrolase [Planctomycetales bacterium]|nr:phosphonoacetate hydrolase [Planctomycetales bacterium]
MLETKFVANGKSYRLPAKPIVVICIDGCADEYLDVAIVHERMPNTARLIRNGHRFKSRGALPSFTNVNNSCIATGCPPSATGISGNYFLDPETGEEVMMNSASYLRCETIFAAAANVGRKVAIVTAKEKLRDILSHGMNGIAFSSEKARDAKMETHGISNVEEFVGEPTPEIYSGDASVYVLKAGAALIEQGKSDFAYLTLTDFMQHKYAPEDNEALDFYADLDTQIGRLLDCNAIIGITADHGMNAKNDSDGRPNVVYLESLLVEQFGPSNKVICPITDPYVVHHGALGSLVMVHVADKDQIETIAQWIMSLDGIAEVHNREMAALKLELPADRIGDLVVMSTRDAAIGRTPSDHDLSLLTGGLRSHGGRYEEMVPMLISHPLSDSYFRRSQGDPRNFDVFDFVCNGVQL